MNIQKIYISHYNKLHTRKQNLETQLKQYSYVYEFCSNYDRDSLTLEDLSLFDDTNVTIDKKCEALVNWCTYGKRGGISLVEKANALEHYNIYKKVVEENIDVALILEDDAVLENDFETQIKQHLSHLPHNWDILYISKGCGGLPQLQPEPGLNVAIMPQRASNTASGYIITKTFAKTILDNILPLTMPIDWELNYIQMKTNAVVYWSVPPLSYDGSHPHSGEHFNYNTTRT